ncbi:peptidoglycan-associated lipoprotein Pal [methane-oxidizing endosymbiont of Gigantopelta aegis]|uniref:peptidoglycan-associated lipoprotein Pal n=1 Tax=methane-oxidizing endosymbiont of Gigantopelta aegis TaxID=2794938 RepID=UPI0018DE02BD|nr:peptidoglycan-associated lipoprotein Pal [methane-oxidizing endosymbiont of Gigantopelta aegis]
MHLKQYKLFGIVLLTLTLAACSSTEEKAASIIDQSQNAGAVVPADGATTKGYSDEADIAGTELSAEELGAEFSDPQSLLSKRTIYFQYDSSQVQQDFIPVIAAHAAYLLQHPNYKLVLEGHADERGSPEYNIALGEQRAKAVSRLMEAQGVPPAQITIVSYGEEKPAVDGHDEAAWQLNRRVELVYEGVK